MKQVLVAAALTLAATAAQAQLYGTGSNSSSHSSSGYTTSRGTYVQPYVATIRTALRWTTIRPGGT